MMRDIILRFPEQFSYEPVIENGEHLPARRDSVLVLGMGGSQLAAELLKTLDPSTDVLSHRDYGIPAMSEDALRSRLIIASSYSGNTEEVLDGFEQARARGLSVAVITVGGELLRRAKQYGVPYIQMPDTGIQPRCALGFSVRSLLAMMGNPLALAASRMLATLLDAASLEEPGRALARELKGRIPVIYASTRNHGVAYNWKIKFNETGKIPAFYNLFPELNHNEANGFDVADSTRGLSERFVFIFLRDSEDNPRNQKRMDVLKKLYMDRGLSVREIPMSSGSVYYKAFSSLVLADWAAMYTAQEQYGLDAEQVPMVEEFKRLMA